MSSLTPQGGRWYRSLVSPSYNRARVAWFPHSTFANGGEAVGFIHSIWLGENHFSLKVFCLTGCPFLVFGLRQQAFLGTSVVSPTDISRFLASSASCLGYMKYKESSEILLP